MMNHLQLQNIFGDVYATITVYMLMLGKTDLGLSRRNLALLGAEYAKSYLRNHQQHL